MPESQPTETNNRLDNIPSEYLTAIQNFEQQIEVSTMPEVHRKIFKALLACSTSENLVLRAPIDKAFETGFTQNFWNIYNAIYLAKKNRFTEVEAYHDAIKYLNQSIQLREKSHKRAYNKRTTAALNQKDIVYRKAFFTIVNLAKTSKK